MSNRDLDKIQKDIENIIKKIDDMNDNLNPEEKKAKKKIITDKFEE